MDEVERIRAVYERRARSIPDDRYSLLNPAHLFLVQQRERALLGLLKRHGFSPLCEKRILDVGCGHGGTLRDFLRYGASPQKLFGVDLLEDSISAARRLSRNIEFCCANAERLPFPDRWFDMVLQVTVFTSILDNEMKSQIASEMLRVLRPSGILIWYDYWLNPTNPDTRGIKPKEVKALFPGCSYEFHRATLAPPIARALARRSWVLCSLLERIPFLTTHYIGILRKLG